MSSRAKRSEVEGSGIKLDSSARLRLGRNDRKKNWAGNNLKFLKFVEAQLTRGRIISARAEAERLISHFSGFSRVDFFTGVQTLSQRQKIKIRKAVKKRISGQPLAYLLGSAGFYGRDFMVNRYVLVPRPETEILVDKVLDILRRQGVSGARILDIGTGSGCIGVSLTIERPDCRITALDVSSEALKIARKNARALGAGGRISFFKSDLFGALSPKKKHFGM